MNIKEIKKTKSNEDLTLTAFIKSASKEKTRNEKTYLKVVLQDLTGEIIFNKWDATAEDSDLLKAGSVVDISSVKVNLYNNDVNLASTYTTKITKSALPKSDFVYSNIPELKDLKDRFSEHYTSIKNPELRIIKTEVLKPNMEMFTNWPAAERMHHDERHGLLFHTVRMLDAITALHAVYGGDLQLMKLAIMLHDLMKIKEYNVDEEYNGSLSKYALIGHIPLCYGELAVLFHEQKITEELYIALSHCILAHHGKIEFGSPVRPSTLEAFLISKVDDIDAKVYTFEKVYHDLEDDEIQQRGSFHLDNARVFKSSWKSEQ